MKKNLFSLIIVVLCLTSAQLLSQTTFTGAINPDWFEAGNWDNGLPALGNDATIPIGGDVIINDDITISYSIDNYGYLVNQGNFVFDGTILNQGIIENYAAIFNQGVIENSGDISNAADFYNQLNGDIINNVNIDNSGYFQNDGDILNHSSIINLSDIENYGNIINNGSIINDDRIENYLSIINNESIINNGFIQNDLIIINNGSIQQNNFGSILNDSSIINNVNIANDGSIVNNVSIENFGNINNCSGTYSGNLPSINLPELCGCTGQLACNYNSSATVDDGSCDYISCLGCTYAEACNYDIEALVEDGTCDFSCIGCIATVEISLDANATVSTEMAGIYEIAEDCIFEEGGAWIGGVDYQVCFRKTDGSNWRIWNTGCGWEIGYTEESSPGFFDWYREARSYTGQCSAITPFGLTVQALNTSTFYNSFGNELNGITGILSECSGCTDPLALNFLLGATLDDGTCVYQSNPCPGDFDGNGVISAFDLSQFLGVFGTSCAP